MKSAYSKAVATGPASMGNFSVGFDVLGVGLNNPADIITATRTDKAGHVTISDILGDDGKIPREIENNTAGFAVKQLLQFVDAEFGVDLKIEKGIQAGSGLGSSAASAAGALMATNSLFENQLTKKELIPFGVAAEKIACGAAHADNVAPAILGGVVLISSYTPLRVYKVPLKDIFWVGAILPEVQVLTAESREALPREIPLSLSSQQIGHFGGSLLGLMDGDPEIVKSHLVDLLLEPHRKVFIPGFEEHKAVALNSGAIAFGIGGAGPTVFALTDSKEIAQKSATGIVESFKALGINATMAVSPLNSDGAEIIELK